MTIDALKCMLNCIEADGRSVTHAIIEDSESKKTSQKIGAASILKKIIIDSIKSSDLLLLPDKGRLDSGRSLMSPLLTTTSNTDQHRACDGVLIRILPEKKDGITPLEIGYFDLKSGNPIGYEGQFLSTRCFFQAYVMELLKTFHNKNCKVVRERYVIFHTDKNDITPSLNKKRSRPVPASANTPQNADKYIVKNGDTIPAHRILS